MTDDNKQNTDANRKHKFSRLTKKIFSDSKTIFESKDDETASESKNTLLPSNQLVLPVVPLRENTIFPHTETVLTFGRENSKNAIAAATKVSGMVVLVTQKRAKAEVPTPNDLYEVGTLAMIDRTLNTDNSINVLVHGVGRVGINRYLRTKPYMLAQVTKLKEVLEKDEELTAMSEHLQKEFRKSVQMGKSVEFLNFMKLMSGVNEGELTDQIASTLSARVSEKQTILEQLNVKTRMKLVIERLSHEIKVLEIEKDVANKTQAKFDKYMRENVLRERLKTIQKELGELDEDGNGDNLDYQKQIKKFKGPDEVKTKISKEIKKLEQLSINNPESGYLKSWIDTMFELPWSSETSSQIDIKKAQQILEKNHYGLPKVKDRILEYIAVLQLKKKNKKSEHVPTILCFVGPPGVGKTSIGKSVAAALNRKFVKISLGGIRDEAEIRGHRRTYVGAMPGRIISGMKQAQTTNPVFMLDEIDKIGNDFRGDPSSALLEALDPEQNSAFEDHYLDTPYDLSQVLFITTANTIDTIPAALRDRLEIIRYSGYTSDDKFHIIKNHLLEKTLSANGLSDKQFKIGDYVIKQVIAAYTREAGVRELERLLGKLMRKTARVIIETPKKAAVKIDAKKLHEFLGPEKFDTTLAEEKDQVGLATGLAWTSVGGQVLFIEVALTPGKGKILMTGKLGDVMKESASAALTFVKANAKKLEIDLKKIEKSDIHIHIPEGAVPKDGPSAGVTLTTALVSAFTNRPVKKEVAMTGEVTLRGRVLRIGGLKEKSIAAHQAGIKTVLIPKDNERDLVEIPDMVKKDIKFKPVSDLTEVIKLALK